MKVLALAVLATASCLFTPALAVKQEDFKQCAQSSFCRRLRQLSTKQLDSPSSFQSPYTVGPASTTAGTIDHASWSFPISTSLYPDVAFELRIDVLAEGDGIARIRIDEVGSKTPWRRYNETAKWVLVDTEPELASLKDVKLEKGKKGTSVIRYGHGREIEVQHSPLRITQKRDGKAEIVLNERRLFHMEHFRVKNLEAADTVKTEEGEGGLSESEQMVLQGDVQDRSWFEDSDADMFEEKWKTWTDSKPKGESGGAMTRFASGWIAAAPS
jgi:alpha 1,3-glucosidase